MKLFKRILATLLAALMVMSMLAACGSSGGSASTTAAPETTTMAKEETKAPEETEASVEVQKKVVAYAIGGVPFAYMDENGNPAGYDIAVFQLIDEMLPQYEFEYVGASDDDMYIGLDTGKYDVGLKDAWYNAERAEKYIYPEHFLGAGAIGFVIRPEDIGNFSSYETIYKTGKKLTPLPPQNAQYGLIKQWNEEHPDMVIEVEESDTIALNDAYLWILEGRYDGYMTAKATYQGLVLNEDGAFHDKMDELAWETIDATETWPLFSKGNEELAAAYDECAQKLEDDGTLSKLAMEYYKENILDYFK